MDQNALYERVYRQLHHCTPLKYDCGRICERACCRGLDQNSGMWLFPGEEELLAREPGFQILPLQRNLANGRPLFWLICAGRCDRARRPLACRIFPLTPRLTAKEIIVVEMDPRARPLCPLAKDRRLLEPDFVRAVARICRELGRDPQIREYFLMLSGEIAELRRLAGLFGED